MSQHNEPTLAIEPNIANEPTLAIAVLKKKLNAGLWVTHISYACFLAVMCWMSFQTGSGNVKIFAVKIFPLLIFIPAFFKQYPRTYSWLCFVILPYFIFITPFLFEKFLLENWVAMALTVVIFIASMMTSRWLQAYRYAQWQLTQEGTNT